MTRRATPRQLGFSLIELLVSLVLVSLVLGGAMAMFNYTNKLSRAQLHEADLQQSARVAQRDLLRLIRMAGRGGLRGYHQAGYDAASGPASITPAIEVRNNVPAATQRLVPGDADSPMVQLDTDVITVRGHFNSPPLFVASTDPTTFTRVANGGVIRVASHSPAGIPQDVSAMVQAVQDQREDAVLIVSALSDVIYGVAQLDPANSNVADYDPDPQVQFDITIAYKYAGGTHTAAYGLLSADGVFPDLNNAHPAWLPARDLQTVGSIALLEEYRYFARNPEDPTGAEKPRLAVTRFFPNTDTPYDSNWYSDIADNVYDFQVALGFDSSFDGTASSNGFFAFDSDNVGIDDVVIDGAVAAGASTDLDDWLFNSPADTTNLGALPWTPAVAVGATPPSYTISQPRPKLLYARLSTLAMTAKPDPGYSAALVASIEDHNYATTPADPVNGSDGRRYRRLLLTTVADLRNL
jgi:prepilin-type N-terminal cleavage/methylation domain-containing protein